MHPASKRFWAKVYYGRECWEWRATKDPKTGFGMFWLDGKPIGAHRAAWIILRGPIPEHGQIMHTCQNPSCVRIEHLRLVSHAAIMEQAADTGRMRKRKRFFDDE